MPPIIIAKHLVFDSPHSESIRSLFFNILSCRQATPRTPFYEQLQLILFLFFERSSMFRIYKTELNTAVMTAHMADLERLEKS